MAVVVRGCRSTSWAPRASWRRLDVKTPFHPLDVVCAALLGLHFDFRFCKLIPKWRRVLDVPSNILDTLAPALASGNHLKWVAVLERIMEEENPDIPIIIGATGGLRKALDEGAVRPEQIHAFKSALEATFQGRAKLQLLTGAQEAQLELTAVRYIGRHALPPFAPQFGGGTSKVDPSELGVLSSGGASSQLAYHPHLQTAAAASVTREKNQNIAPASQNDSAETAYISIPTDLLGAMNQARQYGLEPAMASIEDRLWADIAALGGPLGKLRGIYIVIELAGSICKEAGLADRLVPKREAVSLLVQHLESLRRVAGKDLKVRMAEELADGSTRKPWSEQQSISWYQEARAPLTLLTLSLLDLFSPTAWFYCATSFSVGAANNILRAQWPLGLFLTHAQINIGLDSTTPAIVQRPKL
eukprot:SAG31_NODE_927_length_10930_cov_15.134983_7_plen_416_part_00